MPWTQGRTEGCLWMRLKWQHQLLTETICLYFNFKPKRIKHDLVISKPGECNYDFNTTSTIKNRKTTFLLSCFSICYQVVVNQFKKSVGKKSVLLLVLSTRNLFRMSGEWSSIMKRKMYKISFVQQNCIFKVAIFQEIVLTPTEASRSSTSCPMW